MSEWIEWHGGASSEDWPAVLKTDDVVDVRMRGGSHWTSKVDLADWRHLGNGGDIVAYRLVVPAFVSATSPAPASALDVQVGGSHYKDLKIQPIEYIHANNIPFAEGNVIKYVTRWRTKNGIKDLEKARHFIDLLIELEKKSGT